MLRRLQNLSRVSWLLIFTYVMIGLIAVRLFDIQVLQSARLAEEANNRRSVSQTLYGTRGTVYDAGGIVLAESVERYDITVSPRFVASFVRDGSTVTVDEALAEISFHTGEKQATMKNAILKDPESDFAYLAKAVTIDVLREIQALEIPWVYSDLRPSRTYPRGAVAGNLVGFMGTDGPQTGVEYYQNECLAATDGTSFYERGADGVRIPGSTIVTVEPKQGGDIRLTIDSDLQWFAQQTLQDQGTKLGAAWATAMVVRVADGHILAAADWPSVDPNNVDVTKPDDLGARIFSSPFEPGSIFKPMTIASLLDMGKITQTTKVTVPSRFSVGGAYIKDSFGHATMKWTTTGVLINSSNIGVSMLAKGMSATQRYDLLKSWGIGTETSVNFLGEDPGYLADPAGVDVITQNTQMFGQGVTVTSAQMAQVYQTLGNDGVRIPLTLVSGCEQADGTMTNLPATTPTQVVSAKAAQETVEMMELVVTEGSAAPVLKIPGYRVAAKTGTAEVAQNGVYGNKRIISVAGLAPAEDPQYAVIVTFGLPTNGDSSYFAGPAFSTLMGQVLKYYRVPPSTTKTPDLPEEWGNK
jgi:cell division protein FtsI (penicillin-binding protein 3)